MANSYGASSIERMPRKHIKASAVNKASFEHTYPFYSFFSSLSSSFLGMLWKASRGASGLLTILVNYTTMNVPCFVIWLTCFFSTLYQQTGTTRTNTTRITFNFPCWKEPLALGKLIFLRSIANVSFLRFKFCKVSFFSCYLRHIFPRFLFSWPNTFYIFAYHFRFFIFVCLLCTTICNFP